MTLPLADYMNTLGAFTETEACRYVGHKVRPVMSNVLDLTVDEPLL